MQEAIVPGEASREAAIPSSLRALAAVASRLGVDASVDQLRRRFALQPGEPDTPTLIAIARELGLEAKALHMKFEELPRLGRTLPAILRAKDGGALILEDVRTDPAKGTVAVIRDPSAIEDVVMAIDELHLAEVWEGEAILIKRIHSATDERQPFGMAWLARQVVRERKLFGDIAAAALVSTVFALAPPFIFMIVLDRVLVNHSYSTLNVLVGAILIMLLFETILSYLRRILTQVATTRIDGRLNLYIVEKLLKLPMDYFERTPTGRTLGKLGQIWRIRNFLTGQLFGAFLDAVPLIGLIPAMLILEWHLALMAFGLAGIIFLIVMVFMKPLARLHGEVSSCGTGQGLASGRDDLWDSDGQVVGPGRTATPGVGSARRGCDRRPARIRAHGELSADAVDAVRALDLFRLPGRRRLCSAGKSRHDQSWCIGGFCHAVHAPRPAPGQDRHAAAGAG